MVADALIMYSSKIKDIPSQEQLIDEKRDKEKIVIILEKAKEDPDLSAHSSIRRIIDKLIYNLDSLNKMAINKRNTFFYSSIDNGTDSIAVGIGGGRLSPVI